MLDRNLYDQGRNVMDALMRSLDVTYSAYQKDAVRGVLVPKDHPKLISRGSNTLVFGLDALVGKLSNYGEIGANGHYEVTGTPAGSLAYPTFDITARNLGTLNLGKVIIPHAEEHQIAIGNKPFFYTLMPDLRRGGYEIGEFSEIEKLDLTNREELIDAYKAACEVMLNNGFNVYARHSPNEDNASGARKAILIRHVPGEKGELVLADLDKITVISAAQEDEIVRRLIDESKKARHH